MIRKLRQRHRYQMTGLAVCLPLVFIGGIAARRPVPAATGLPAALTAVAPETVAGWREVNGCFPRHALVVRLGRVEGQAGEVLLELAGPANFIQPDLLVYWVDGTAKAEADGGLPVHARLLGGFGPGALQLPPGATDGELVLYSLADGTVVAMSRPLGPELHTLTNSRP